MKEILVLSDTHQNIKLLRKAIKKVKSDNIHITHFFHLGDNYEDIEENYDLTDNKIILRVPGIYHNKYLDGSLPKFKKITIHHWNFLLLHSLDDLPDNYENIDLVCFGHTHEAEVYKKQTTYFLNPGHLKSKNETTKPSYAVVDVSEETIYINIKTIDKEMIKSVIINRQQID